MQKYYFRPGRVKRMNAKKGKTSKGDDEDEDED